MAPIGTAVHLILLAVVARVADASYDRSPVQFTPAGRIAQIGYALKAARRGRPVVCIKCRDGVALFTSEKERATRLVVGKSAKIDFPTPDICVTASGLRYDTSYIFRKIQEFCRDHLREFGEVITADALASELSEHIHMHTLTASSRPLGVDVIVAGLDAHGESRIYVCSAAGRHAAWRAIALGKRSSRINQFLHDEVSLWKNNTIEVVGVHLLPRLRRVLVKKTHSKSKDIGAYDNDYEVYKYGNFSVFNLFS